MSETPGGLTPQDRAHHDALALAVEDGLAGEEASRYADALRGSLWFQSRALRYAVGDMWRAIRRTLYPS